MNFQFPVALRGTIRKNIVRPPAFEVSTTPDRDPLDQGKVEGAIDPSATRPFWRSDGPIRMIIERHEHEWLFDPAQPKRGEIMKIARAINDEGSNAVREIAIKVFDQAGRRAKTQTRTPLRRFDRG